MKHRAQVVAIAWAFSALHMDDLKKMQDQKFSQQVKLIDSTAYLHSALKQYIPSRRLRSSDCSLLAVPRVRTCFGFRSFAVAAPTTWNSLPLHIRNSSSISGFRRQLKTFLYNLAFDPF